MAKLTRAHILPHDPYILHHSVDLEGVDLCFCVNVAIYEPFVVCEFVAMVIPGDNVHQEYVLGFWVESCDLHLVTGEHPPSGNIVRENYQHSLSKTFKHPKDKTSPCQAHLSQMLDLVHSVLLNTWLVKI